MSANSASDPQAVQLGSWACHVQLTASAIQPFDEPRDWLLWPHPHRRTHEQTIWGDDKHGSLPWSAMRIDGSVYVVLLFKAVTAACCTISITLKPLSWKDLQAFDASIVTAVAAHAGNMVHSTMQAVG